MRSQGPSTWLQIRAVPGADALNDNHQLVEHGLAIEVDGATSDHVVMVWGVMCSPRAQPRPLVRRTS